MDVSFLSRSFVGNFFIGSVFFSTSFLFCPFSFSSSHIREVSQAFADINSGTEQFFANTFVDLFVNSVNSLGEDPIEKIGWAISFVEAVDSDFVIRQFCKFANRENINVKLDRTKLNQLRTKIYDVAKRLEWNDNFNIIILFAILHTRSVVTIDLEKETVSYPGFFSSVPISDFFDTGKENSLRGLIPLVCKRNTGLLSLWIDGKRSKRLSKIFSNFLGWVFAEVKTNRYVPAFFANKFFDSVVADIERLKDDLKNLGDTMMNSMSDSLDDCKFVNAIPSISALYDLAIFLHNAVLLLDNSTFFVAELSSLSGRTLNGNNYPHMNSEVSEAISGNATMNYYLEDTKNLLIDEMEVFLRRDYVMLIFVLAHFIRSSRVVVAGAFEYIFDLHGAKKFLFSAERIIDLSLENWFEHLCDRSIRKIMKRCYSIFAESFISII
jgi:hypothetical protein